MTLEAAYRVLERKQKEWLAILAVEPDRRPEAKADLMPYAAEALYLAVVRNPERLESSFYPGNTREERLRRLEEDRRRYPIPA